MELLQEGGELLLLRWRQVPQSHLFPEPTLLEGAAVERKTGMRRPAHITHVHSLLQVLLGPVPVDQLKKLLVLQLLVQCRCCQLLLLLQPLLVHVSLSRMRVFLVMLHSAG